MNQEELEQLANKIETDAKAGEITCDNDAYWVAGMEYAAKLIRNALL